MPDLLGYWLTGVRAAEQTNASTTGLLDARTGDWAAEVVEGLGLPPGCCRTWCSPAGCWPA